MKEFRIVLDSVSDAYESGSSIRGSVIFDCTADEHGKLPPAPPPYYNHISVNLSGKALFKKNPLSSYSESFCVVYLKVWKPSSGTRTLTQGRHSFPFRFEVPSTAPSSLEGKWGYLRYTLSAHVWVDKISSPGLIQVPIYHTELGNVNIRQMVRVEDVTELQPLSESVELRSEGIKLTVGLPTTAYDIGNVLSPRVTTENNGKHPVHLLRQKVSCVTRSGECGSSKTNVFSGRITPSSALYTREPTASIPPITLISSNSQCTLIQVSHILQVEAVVPRSHKSIKVRIALRIGNQPSVNVEEVSPNTELGEAADKKARHHSKRSNVHSDLSHSDLSHSDLRLNRREIESDGDLDVHSKSRRRTRSRVGLSQARSSVHVDQRALQLSAPRPGQAQHPLVSYQQGHHQLEASMQLGVQSQLTNHLSRAQATQYSSPVGWIPQLSHMPGHKGLPPLHSHDPSLPSYEEAVAYQYNF